MPTRKIYDAQGVSHDVEYVVGSGGGDVQVVQVYGTVTTGAGSYSSGTHAEVSATGTAGALLAADTGRVMWRVYNTHNTDTAYISVDGGDATSSDWPIRAGESIGSQELGVCTGAISCIRGGSNNITLKVVSA